RDETPETLHRYRDLIAYSVSEPDKGQTDAINKGLSRMTGTIWSYLNSDDLLTPGALHRVNEAFQARDIRWVSGRTTIFGPEGDRGTIEPRTVKTLRDYLPHFDHPERQSPFPCSCASFMHREVIDRIGCFEEYYHYSMDIEYWVRAVFEGEFRQTIIPDILARWRWHPECKTLKNGMAYGFREDEIRIAKAFASYLKDEENDRFLGEITQQERLLPARKAMHWVRNNQRADAAKALFTGLLQHPGSFLQRPWLGALRQLILPTADA
ncbi:MAG: glycosyltransferase, partial [Verrucomicrobiota bacterium]